MNKRNILQFRHKPKLCWGMVIALAILVLYSYPAFMGYYLYEKGNLVKALAMLAIFLVLMIAAVYMMCIAKANKGKLWVRRSVFLLCCVLLAGLLLVSGRFFNGYMALVGERDELKNNVETIVKDAGQMDAEYDTYVQQRVDDYIDFESGNPDAALLAKSLKSHLAPPSLSDIRDDRKHWLQNIEGMTVFNVSFPSNLNLLKGVIADWEEQYQQLSDIGYGDQYQTFKYSQAGNSIANLWKKVKNPPISWVAILAAFICAVIMVWTPWLVTDPTPAEPLFSCKKNNSDDSNGPTVI